MPSNNPKKREERVREIRLWWERDPNGPVITRTDPPSGLRTCEGFVWGHKVDHIFWIQRIPGVNAMTVWSRSMLKELGEGYAEHEWDEPLVEPRVLRPWPVLKLLQGLPSPSNPPIGAIDGGCECEHAEQVTYQIRPDEEYKRPLEDAADVPGDVPPSSEESMAAKKEETKEKADADVEMAESSAETVPDTSDPAASGSVISSVEDEGSELDESQDEGSESEASQDEVQDDSDKPQKDQANVEKPSATKLFSVKGLPKLEEFIPEQFFPDVLMVHDPDNATNQPKNAKGGEAKPIKYIRHYPTSKRGGKNSTRAEDASTEARVAQLHLSKANRFGAGNHSYVYRAPLTLPEPLSAHSPTGQVTVAAKLSYARCTAHNLLRNEAGVYNSFPKNIQEEYCGYNIVPQCRFPVPAAPIVPKFFGYYLPVNDRGEVLDNHHDNCSERNPCTVAWPSPILLMEECGSPVEPSQFTLEQRTECFSLILRLHYLEIVQGSFYVRNIMMQPGPLTVPPEKRSSDTPSFRIIDFGRGESWEWYVKDPRKNGRYLSYQDLRHEFMASVGDELARARKELLIEDFGF